MNYEGPVEPPPLKKIAAALREITETLALQVAGTANKEPDWSHFQWRIARAVSAMHGISTLLQSKLPWRGPDGWADFLLEQRVHSVARSVRITGILETIDAVAGRQGRTLIALKGAALNAIGLYAPGERPMADIDLLIADGQPISLESVLEACDYEIAFTSPRHQVFQPRARAVAANFGLGEHADVPIKIEVHQRIAERLPAVSYDITRLLLSRDMHPGVNAYPSMAALMLHQLLHAAGNMRARALRLIQLHDISLVAARLSADDWTWLLNMRSKEDTFWWGFAPLVMAARYYSIPVPPRVFAEMGMNCPRLLARYARRRPLATVSWSNIRIEAFPGLEWAGTFGEAIEFMTSRIWPSREALAEMKHGAGQIQGSESIPWYRISHPARIFRWIFARPARVQTLLVVNAALMQER